MTYEKSLAKEGVKLAVLVALAVFLALLMFAAASWPKGPASYGPAVVFTCVLLSVLLGWVVGEIVLCFM